MIPYNAALEEWKSDKKEEKKEEPKEKEAKVEKSETYFVADATDFLKGQRDRILSCFKEEGAK